MLLELSIKNFAIIDDLKVSFTRGLNLLTGETGAGKSIIIEALGIVLGGRGNKRLIRDQEKPTVLQALFSVDNLEELRPLLDQYGIHVEENNLLIITREISIDRPSISRINDKTVTLTVLNEVSSQLVDIFAQHEHQSLLDVNNHKVLIDSFGDNDFHKLKSEIYSLYQAYTREKQRLEKMDKSPREREREIDLLKFQIQEIDLANLSDYDEDNIEKEYKKLSNVKDISVGLDRILELFSSSQFDHPSIFNFINENISILEDLAEFDKDLKDYLEDLKETYYNLQDLHNSLLNYVDNIYIDNSRLDFLSERLDEVNRLKDKYGNSIQEILNYRNKINEELEELINYEEEIEKINRQVKKYKKELYNLSKKLSTKRKNIAKTIERQIIKELRELNMQDIDFKVNFKENKNLGVDGIDLIEFLISTNPGEDLKPLSKIVSGGEMSRIMLAFKSVLADYDNIPTLIFDEIDTGISGRTAQVVGEKISNISKNHQVISITHLPQITALADSHYLISKIIKNQKTLTQIEKLNKKERIEELARLLGGVDVTSTTINHAKEMIEMSKKLS